MYICCALVGTIKESVIRIPEMSRDSLGMDTTVTAGFVVLFGPFAERRQYLQLGHYRLLPYPFQFIMYYHPVTRRHIVNDRQ